MSDKTYQRSLPKKRMSAGALFFDEVGRLLVVEPAYKANWEIPGGVVELDESPREARMREAKEELGVERPTGTRRTWKTSRPNSDVGAGWRGQALGQTNGLVSAPTRPRERPSCTRPASGRVGRDGTPSVGHRSWPAHPAPAFL